MVERRRDGDHRIRPAAIDAASRTQNTASHAENRSDRYPSKSEGLYEEEAEAAAVFLRDYALTGEREYFAEYFACYLRAGNDMERAAEMERLTPQTYGWFAALEKNGWGCEVS